MAWRSHGKTNAELIRNLRSNGIIRSDSVENAMLAVDRGNFSRNNPFMDAPQSIGFGVTISAPHMHAHALELLKDRLEIGTRALDVGSGSGYLTACMSVIMGPKGVDNSIKAITERASQHLFGSNRNVTTDNWYTSTVLLSETTRINFSWNYKMQKKRHS
ncbi:hypothetical protein JTB14_012879 [Gonioctena quinquepunctata]|nr:hypothetical protein JTB14_012879 [Gonioctena quinquepunctata]